MNANEKIGGAEIISNILKKLDVKVVFGIVGIPVIEIADAIISNGIKFIGFRNEQAASYAASVYGYLTQKPGVLLVVGGPGVINAMAGLENSRVNNWPLLILAGSSESSLVNRGAFQELDQISLLRPYVKFASKPNNLIELPRIFEQAYRVSYFGKPGATYIDLPADLIQSNFNKKDKIYQFYNLTFDNVFKNYLYLNNYSTNKSLEPPRTLGDPDRINNIIHLLSKASFPLLIIGKGAAYSKAESNLKFFVKNTNIHFLPTPMGKGVVPDSWPQNLSAARSAALKYSDLILIVGARLNWILHFGDSPKWGNPQRKFILIDTSAEELGNNHASPVLGIQGDAQKVIEQINNQLIKSPWKAPPIPAQVVNSLQKNEASAKIKANTPINVLIDKETNKIIGKSRLSYQRVYALLRNELENSVPGKLNKLIYVSEGANTMDVARSSFDFELPRQRLDAGTNATMGIGLGYAIAAASIHDENNNDNNKSKFLPIALEGDSAFGFSGMELETASRYGLGLIVVIMNNNGVYHGAKGGSKLYDGSLNTPLPSTALGFETRYDIVANGLGAHGFLVRTENELVSASKQAIDLAWNKNKVAVLNVLIETGEEKELKFGWMASTNTNQPKL